MTAAQPSFFDDVDGAPSPVRGPTPADAALHHPYTPPVTTAGGARAFDPHAPLGRGITLLEASAGTGKTYAIATLVLRLVAEEGVPIGRVLVVTFTTAATTELRERVRRRLRDAHAAAVTARLAGPDALPRGTEQVTARVVREAHAGGTLPVLEGRLRDALEQFDDAPISTIHGFCARVLREHAFACGAELDGELLADDGDLVDEVVRDFWARESAARPLALVRRLCAERVGLDALAGLTRRALRHADADCDPDCPPAGDVEARLAAWADALAQVRAHVLDPDCTAFEAVDEAIVAKRLDGRKWRTDWVAGRVRDLHQWCAGDPEGTKAPDALVRFSKRELHAARGKGGEPPEHPLFEAIDALLTEDAHLARCVAAELLRLRHACVQWARTEVARRKAARRQHGYDDLLRLVRDALRRDDGAEGPCDAPSEGPLARALRESFRAALIDEFQDTDAVQWEIFRRAFGHPAHRLVLIGDPKQAIYAFRGADIRTYLAARGAAAGDAVLALDRNWRTDGPLVAALEALAGPHPNPFGEPTIGWRRVHAQHEAARLDGAPTAAPLVVRFLPRDGVLAPRGAKGEDGGAALVTRGRLARHLPDWVAADVVRFLRARPRLPDARGVVREARPSDVAVLVRSNKQARAIQAALRRAGVPAVVHGATSVLATREAHELAAVLAAVLEPSNPRLLRAALGTDLLGIVAGAELAAADGPDASGPLGPGDAIARLEAAGDGDGDAYADDDAAHDGAMPDDAAHDARIAGPSLDRWAERMRGWRAAWRGGSVGSTRPGDGQASVVRLVRALVDDLDLPARLLALDDGERRLTNLLHVAEVLHAAAVARALEPGATLAWLREQIALGDAPGDDVTRQLRLESDAEAAQVVTVHSSKGLEYGAVWCPYLWDGDLARDDDKAHPCLPDADGRHRLHLTPDGDCGDRVDDDVFAEGLRLAYVALTRARHRLTLWWGAVNGKRTSFESSPLAWLLHGPDAPDAGTPRAARHWLRDRVRTLGDDALLERLQAVAARAPALVAVEVEDVAHAPGDDVVRWADERPRAPALAARPWTRTAPLDDGWRLGSFTGLTAGAHAPRAHADGEAPGEGAAADLPEALGDAARTGRHGGEARTRVAREIGDASEADGPTLADALDLDAPDADVADADAAHAADAPAADTSVDDARLPVPLAEFPASAAAGIFFHEVLERHDPTRPERLGAEVRHALVAHGFDVAPWERPVTDALRTLLDLPLVADPAAFPDASPAPLRLADVAPRDRLAELRFELPAAAGPGGGRITPHALARCIGDHASHALAGATLEAYATRLAALGFRPLRGFLTGAIDLVVRHDDRWWLLDYKSNRLGTTWGDYGHSRVSDEMTHAHYVLQYHLYTLALHRWLRLRQPGYDYERHVGGAFYLFLRGLAPAGGERPARGVWFERPPRARIEALDRLFTEGRTS